MHSKIRSQLIIIAAYVSAILNQYLEIYVIITPKDARSLSLEKMMRG